MDPKRHGYRLKIFVVMLLIASSADAGFYKWTDKNGRVHYSDKPADENKSTEVIVDTESRSGITNSSSDVKERNRMTRELENDRKERAEDRDKKHAEKQKQQKRCARAKDDLRRYQSAGNIYELNKQGERVFYSKKKRSEKEQSLRKKVVKEC
jgi:hypothetical protein